MCLQHPLLCRQPRLRRRKIGLIWKIGLGRARQRRQRPLIRWRSWTGYFELIKWELCARAANARSGASVVSALAIVVSAIVTSSSTSRLIGLSSKISRNSLWPLSVFYSGIIFLVDEEELYELYKRFRKLDIKNRGLLTNAEFLELEEFRVNPFRERLMMAFPLRSEKQLQDDMRVNKNLNMRGGQRRTNFIEVDKEE